MAGEFDWQDAAHLYDVPPWLINGDYPPPRFPRLRWALRRFWKIPRL